jgi:hypothetical protein
MSQMETFAIAARLHVVMRRAMGRVTDVDWMTHSRDYAFEVIRLARGHADPELQTLADKFEAVLSPPRLVDAPQPHVVTASAVIQQTRNNAANVRVPSPRDAAPASRYVGRLR